VHRETSGSTFLPSGFSALYRAFSSTICDRIETEISRVDLRTPRATQRISRTISVRVPIARDFRSRIGQALSKKIRVKEHEEISSAPLISSFMRCCDPVETPAGGVSIPTAKRSADPKNLVSNGPGGDRSNAVDRRGGRVTIRFRSAIS
jgi:hypothetical protein